MLLQKVLRQVVIIVHSIAKNVEAWTRPATDSLIGSTVADLVKSKPALIAEKAFLR
jgi:hypothetical protein